MIKRIYKNCLISAIVLFALASNVHAVTSGAGTSILNGSVATDSNTKDFLYSSASDASCTGTPAPTGKLVIDTTDTILQWCSGNVIKYVATGNTTGSAVALNTGAGTDGSRGITFTDNVSTPVPTPTAGATVLHSQGGTLYTLVSGGTAPGIRVSPILKVATSTQDNSTTTYTNVTALSSFALRAGGTYVVTGAVRTSISAATADPAFRLNTADATTGCTFQANAQFRYDGVSTTLADTSATAFGGDLASTVGTTNPMVTVIYAVISGCTGAVTFDLQFKAAGTGTVTIGVGSFMRVEQVS